MASSSVRAGGYYYGWNIVAITGLSQLASFGIAINCLSLYLPGWSRDLHAPVSQLAFCYTAPGAVFCFLGPLTGYAADRWLSVRWMMTTGLAGVALMFVLASRVTEAWQLLTLFATIAPLSMVIAGWVPSQVLVARWFERRRGMAIGMSALGQSMAGAILPPILAIALPAIGWRHLFLIVAAFIALVCVPIAALFLRDRPRPDQGQGVEFTPEGAAAAASQATITTKAILSRPNFWIVAACSLTSAFMASGFSVNIAPMAASQNLAPTQTATLLSALSLVALAAKLIAGYAIDRVGGRVVLTLILALGVAGMGVVQVLHGFTGLLLGTLLIASTGGAIVPVAATIAREYGPSVVGRAMGLIAFVGVIGVTAPPIVAFMREATGGYRTPLQMLMVLGSLAFVCGLMLRQPKAAPAAAVPATA